MESKFLTHLEEILAKNVGQDSNIAEILDDTCEGEKRQVCVNVLNVLKTGKIENILEFVEICDKNYEEFHKDSFVRDVLEKLLKFTEKNDLVFPNAEKFYATILSFYGSDLAMKIRIQCNLIKYYCLQKDLENTNDEISNFDLLPELLKTAPEDKLMKIVDDFTSHFVRIHSSLLSFDNEICYNFTKNFLKNLEKYLDTLKYLQIKVLLAITCCDAGKKEEAERLCNTINAMIRKLKSQGKSSFYIENGTLKNLAKVYSQLGEQAIADQLVSDCLSYKKSLRHNSKYLMTVRDEFSTVENMNNLYSNLKKTKMLIEANNCWSQTMLFRAIHLSVTFRLKLVEEDKADLSYLLDQMTDTWLKDFRMLPANEKDSIIQACRLVIGVLRLLERWPDIHKICQNFILPISTRPIDIVEAHAILAECSLQKAILNLRDFNKFKKIFMDTTSKFSLNELDDFGAQLMDQIRHISYQLEKIEMEEEALNLYLVAIEKLEYIVPETCLAAAFGAIAYLAQRLNDEEKIAKYEKLAKKNLKRMKSNGKDGMNSFYVADCYRYLGKLYWNLNNFVKSERYLKKAVDIQTVLHGRYHHMYCREIYQLLADLYKDQKNFAAESEALEGLIVSLKCVKWKNEDALVVMEERLKCVKRKCNY